ncbi:hypothetical protein EV182_007547, partial [Spiromyces aspiralis]
MAQPLGGALMFEKKLNGILRLSLMEESQRAVPHQSLQQQQQRRNITPRSAVSGTRMDRIAGTPTRGPALPRRRAVTMYAATPPSTNVRRYRPSPLQPEGGQASPRTPKTAASPYHFSPEFASRPELGHPGPDPLLTPDECGERIGRLLRKVQQTRREVSVRREIGSASTVVPNTPTRFDIDALEDGSADKENEGNGGGVATPSYRQRSRTIATSTAAGGCTSAESARRPALATPLTTANNALRGYEEVADDNRCSGTDSRPKRLTVMDIRRKREALKAKRAS